MKSALQISRTRAILGIIACAIVVINVSAGVIMCLLGEPTPEFPESGLKTFRMFTTDSNILMALAALFCIPYEIDGLRHRNTHLPRWIITLLYMGVTGVAITLIMCLCLLGPFAGYTEIFLQMPNMMMHLICPVTGIVLFVFINNDKKLTIKETLISLIPLVIYFILYLILVFLVGEENGGWRDHYGVNKYVPLIVPIIVVPVLGFVISTLLRLAHNQVKAIRDRSIEKYYLKSAEFDFETARECVANLALLEKVNRKEKGDLYIPRRIIRLMMKKYAADADANQGTNVDTNAGTDIGTNKDADAEEALCHLYMSEYLK